MEFKLAAILKEKNKHLLGKQDNGATIDELILVPSDSNSADKFLKSYIRTLDGEKSIIPFLGEDVDIIAVFDKERIREQQFLFHTNISNLSSDLGVITE